jgi:hypothetical protein
MQPAVVQDFRAEELCYLRSRGVSFPEDSTVCRAVFARRTCATGQLDACDNAGRRGLPLANRSTLYGRYSLLRDLHSRADSHLLAVLNDSALPILLFGDSTTKSLAEALVCEAERAGIEPSVARRRITFVGMLFGNTNRNSTLTTVRARIQSMEAGVVIANLGTHYHHPARLAEMRQYHFKIGNRPQHQFPMQDMCTDTQLYLGLLEEFGQRCPLCISVFLTSFAQHFANREGDGVYDLSAVVQWTSKKHNRLPNASRLPPVLDKANFAFGLGCVPNRATPDNMSPASWRSAIPSLCMPMMAPHVLLVPAHTISEQWWDAHQGWAREFTAQYVESQGGQTPECTHYCGGLFMYEPITWAVRAILESRKPLDDLLRSDRSASVGACVTTPRAAHCPLRSWLTHALTVRHGT